MSRTTRIAPAGVVVGRRSVLAAVALAGFLWLCLGGAASAAAPANDDFADAAVLTGLPVGTTGTNVDATTEAGEPEHTYLSFDHSVWWSWTAPSDGDVTVDTCGSDFPTVLAVYTGTSVAALTPVASNQMAFDYCGADQWTGASKLSFTAHAGQVYKIAVDGSLESLPTGNVALALSKSPRPANDDFAKAAVLAEDQVGRVFSATTNAGASKETGEPYHAGDAGGRSVWWKWTASWSGGVAIHTCGRDPRDPGELDTLLAVYTGSSVAALTEVTSNDDSCGKGSAVTFRANAGQTYYIAADGAGGAVGAVYFFPTGTGANDYFVDAAPLSGLTASAMGSIYRATREPGEPKHAGNAAGRSIWWRWTAPAKGSVRVEAGGGNYWAPINTVLAVYTGNAVSALTEVASNDDAPPFVDYNTPLIGSAVTFTASAGCTYRIAVDHAARTFPGDGGVSISLRETATSGGPPPPCPTENGGPPPSDPPAGATAGDDTLTGTPGPDLICGLGGSDVIKGLAGNDMLFGDACRATARLPRAVLAAASDGNDSLFGGHGDDRLHGAGGKDRLFGGRGSDTLHGGRGNDLLHGNTGRDRLRGGHGNDRIRAKDGRGDTVNCGPGRDHVRADNRDRLRGCEEVRRG